MEKMKKIRKILDSFDFPAEINNGFYIEMYSDREIVLTGKVDIEELDESVLKLEYLEHQIEVYGEKLRIETYTADGIRISGKINKVEFT